MDSGVYGPTTRVYISSIIFFPIGLRHFGYTACNVYSQPPYTPLTPPIPPLLLLIFKALFLRAMIKLIGKPQGYKTVNKSTNDKGFDRVAFYEEYYRNLSPTQFSVKRDSNKIIIEILDSLDGLESLKPDA